MKNLSTLGGPLAAATFLALAASSAKAQFVMSVDSGDDVVRLLSGVDGSLAVDNFIVDANDAATYDFMTPLEAIQVGNEIWVSDQVADSIFRFDTAGTYLSKITGPALDNVRGISVVGNRVFATTGNSSQIATYDFAGNALGAFVAAGSSSPSSYDAVAYGNQVLVSDITDNALKLFSLGGTQTGDLVAPGTFGFAQQLFVRANGDVLVGSFSPGSGGTATAGLFEVDAFGNVVNTYLNAPAQGVRGVYELLNGHYLASAGGTIYDVNPFTNVETAAFTGTSGSSFRYFGVLNAPIPEPTSMALPGLGGLALLRRRKSPLPVAL